MNIKIKVSFVILSASMTLLAACASQPATQTRNESNSTNQTHHQHDAHLAQVNERGDTAMGFSHQKTTHRFRLLADGGAIEVTANDAGDAESQNQIRQHLRHIAQMFGGGNFEAPMLTHGKTPPGVSILQKLKSEVTYRYEEIERGGRVRITTGNKEALAAAHEFLRFQIADHQTGDSTEIEKP
jgi:TolA-binding protein